jgi:hypothetical protein
MEAGRNTVFVNGAAKETGRLATLPSLLVEQGRTS